MSSNQMVGVVALSIAVLLAGVAGCGGSRNSSDPPEAQDFALGTGDVNAQWASSSTELVHDGSRGALYYLDVENQDVVAIDVASGDDSTLVSLLIGPSKLRLTADSQDIYILESDTSADSTGGFPDLIRYNISGNFFGSPIELDSELRVDDFVATNNEQVVVAGYQASGTEIYFSLFNANGGFLDEESFDGTGFVVQQLALAADQQTVLSSLVRNANSVLNTMSIAGNSVNMTGSANLTLAQTAVNTYEPEGERVFRNNGTVWEDGEAEKSLGSNYESIDFDLDDGRIVMLVEGGSGFIIRYFDLDSLDVLSEQTLPTVADAAGMEPVKLFVDDDNLYVVYREVASAATRDYVLVEFEYP